MLLFRRSGASFGHRQEKWPKLRIVPVLPWFVVAERRETFGRGSGWRHKPHPRLIRGNVRRVGLELRQQHIELWLSWMCDFGTRQCQPRR
jgi:hypothetical protein